MQLYSDFTIIIIRPAKPNCRILKPHFILKGSKSMQHFILNSKVP